MIFKYDSTEVSIPVEEYSKILVRASGGADSSILLVLICEAISRLQLNAEVFIASIYWKLKPFGKIYMTTVYDEVRSMYPNVRIHEPTFFECTDLETYSTMQVYAEEYMMNKHGVQISFVGVTKNPTENDTNWGSVWDWRDKRRDDGNSYIEEFKIMQSGERKGLAKCAPFKNISKRQTCDLYKMMNVLETLYPMTYSCEGYPQDNDYYQKHCGKCWWCKEREWGFGKT